MAPDVARSGGASWCKATGLVGVAVCALLAYSCQVREQFFQEAVTKIAGELRQPALAGRLEVAPNPMGWGALVFLRSDDEACEPTHTWVYAMRGATYAVDSGSRTLTPNLPTLAEASEEHRIGIGVSDHFEHAIRDYVCQLPRTASGPR